MVAPRSRAQARGLLLLVLVLGQEAQVVSAKAADASKNGTLGGGGVVADELDAFEQPHIAVTTLAEQGGAPLRSLLTPEDGWSWPADTRLMFSTPHNDVIGDVQPESADVVTLFPGINYNMIRITAVSSTNFNGDHDNAHIKLVAEAATRYDCHKTEYDIPVGTYTVATSADDPPNWLAAQMGSMNGPLGLTITDQYVLEAAGVSVFFMWGGKYKLCYTPDGSFDETTQWRENVLDVDLKILGVRSPCEDSGVYDGCIREERWECAFAYKGEASADCVFNFRSDGGRPDWSVEAGDVNKITWTSIYNADQQTNGVLDADNPGKRCTASPYLTADPFNVGGGDLFLDADRSVAATMPPVVAGRTEPFTVAACFCPSYDSQTGQPCVDNSDPSRCCHEFPEFIQQVGVLYYWTIKICDYNNYDTCTTPYMRVLPQQMFVTRVECPPGGGCSATDGNRIMYIDASSNNDRPTWDNSHGCKTTTVEPTSVVWPAISDSRNLGGGSRIDWKVWRTKQVRINKSLMQAVDLCFCNDNCQIPTNWFKVGQVRTANNFAYASKIGSGANAQTQTIRYVDHPGSFTLYGGILTDGASTTADPYDGNEYSGKALINIISYDRQTWLDRQTLEKYFNYDETIPSDFQEKMDAECQRERYSNTLVDGPSHQQSAKAYVAKVSDNSISQYHSFSGENQDQTMFVKSAGVVAVCYCAMVNAQNECDDPAYWIFTGRMTIHGPSGGQQWIFPTNIVVKLSVLGWGLSAADRLRIIPATSECTANTNDPMGDQHFKVGCPAQDGNGCTTAAQRENIMVNILTGEPTGVGGSGVTITNVLTYTDHTELTFSEPIDSLLTRDDIITIDPSRVLVDGNFLEIMTPAQKFEAYRFTGIYQFQDDTTKTYQVGHRVSPVATDGNVDPYKLSINAGWPTDGPAFTFTDSQGWWTRRNKLETNHELKGKSAEANLKLCWGVSDGGSTSYYAQAGEVTFEDPPPMRAARINLTTKQRDAFAPIVISIETDSQRNEYAGATGKTMLVLRFLDTSGANGKLIPIKAGDLTPTGGTVTGNIPGSFGDDDEVLPENSRQLECAKLFNEVWSTHEEGFPLPHGCFYGRKYRDEPEPLHGEPDPKFFREIVIVFSERNGIRQGYNYQLVMNAQAKTITAPDEELVDIYAMCYDEVGCQRPFMVFEKGQAKSSMATETAAGDSDPFWGQDGFFIQRGDAVTQVLSLSDVNILQARITAMDGVRAISPGAMIRVYLWPLMQWSVGSEDCIAECIPFHGDTNQVCHGVVGCRPEEVVAGSNRKNVIRLTLPAQMSDITSTITHTIKITGLTLPVAGFFPSRMGAELTKSDNTAPAFTTSTGMFWKDPDAGQTTGRLVLTDRTGYGPRPFAGETDQNILYVRLQVGATIWNVGEDAAASITITLPSGYVCSVPNPDPAGGPGGVPPMDLPPFTKDIPIDGYPDNNRGVLSMQTTDGDWSTVGNVCEYVFAPYNAMFANQVAYVKLTVTNPPEAMSKQDPQNVWKLKISSKGASTLTERAYDMTEVFFISTAEEISLNDEGSYWAGNTAVISQLTEQAIQPADFTKSCCGSLDTAQEVTHEYLRIFFKTDKVVGQEGYVIIDAPDGFDFGESCSARDLDARYYAFAGTDNPRLRQLANMGDCVGLRYPLTASTHNRAKLQVHGNIGQGFYYGFELHVTHPTGYSKTQQEGWYIWTQDMNGYGIEGSYESVRFNPLQAASQREFYHRSWGMYNAEVTGMRMYIESMRPQRVSGVQYGEKVTFYPIEFPVATLTSLRITAPVGFVWADPENSEFQRRSNSTTEDFPVPSNNFFGVANQLVWESFNFRANVKYGFTAQIEVPDHNPRNSSNSFFVEFGFMEQDLELRLQASVIPAPPVTSLINCGVGYASNLVSNIDNRIEFRVQTVTPLVDNDGIVIKGDQNTQGFLFEDACNPVMLPGSPPMTSIICSYAQAGDGAPQITLKVPPGITLEPDYYRFELWVSNPTVRVLTAGLWTFGSYKQVDTYPNDNEPSFIIDAELVAPGFVVNDAMTDAQLVDIDDNQRIATNRDDRPGQPNQLIFRFKLRSTPQTPQQLVLQGPRGFVFDQDCLQGVKTNANEVFGDNTEGSWPAELYQKWPNVEITACEGEDHVARLTIQVGLERNNFYVFRIAVRENPRVTPQWNLWSINYNDETSAPFPGFLVWTFTNLLQPAPVSFAKSPTGANAPRTENPVTLQFQPYKTIPQAPAGEARGGLLRITAPGGFAFVSASSKCVVDLYENGDTSTLFERCTLKDNGDWALETGDYICDVDETAEQLNVILTGARPIHGLADGQGKAYTLVVRTNNPVATGSAGMWELDSFSDSNAEPEASLDVSQVQGYPVNNVLITFAVLNVENVIRGNVRVTDIDITLRFPDPIKDYDAVTLRGPTGFNTVGDAETNTCKDFRYAGMEDPFPVTGLPSCFCESQEPLECTLRWIVVENKDPAWAQNTDIRFKIGTTNPVQTPSLTHNFWRVEHTRGTGFVKSSHVSRSWDISPQLDPVDIVISGDNMAAGTLSQLTFTITPVQNAGTIKIEALDPPGFDFSMAQVSVPFDPAYRQGNTMIIHLRTSPLVAGQPFVLRINSVSLGSGGGQTKWNLYTYADTEMQLKLDERLQFEGGFVQPGKITFLDDPQLQTRYQQSPNLYPVMSLFQPRVMDQASAIFRVSFSQPVFARQLLVIACQGEGAYILEPVPFIIIGLGQVQVSTVIDQTGALYATLLPGRPPDEIALQPDTQYTITMQVMPMPGMNTWRLDTLDETAAITNTNDGMTQGFAPVETMVVTVHHQRSPPKAVIEITLDVDPGSAIVRELLVVAPLGFTFDDRAAGCGDMCVPGNSLNGRRTATIASPTGEQLTKLTGLRIRVMTPESMIVAIPWFVEGRGMGTGTVSGWGEADGFAVTQMTFTNVYYAGIPNLRATQIAFTFSVDIDAGTTISVEPPPGYLLTCSMEGSLKQISLPGGMPNCIDDPLQLQLSEPLTANLYAFAVNVDLPEQTPAVNTFNIIIRDQESNVVDAAYNLPGQDLFELDMDLPTLGWSRAIPGQPTTVTVGLTFNEATNRVKAILITLPDLFQHDVQIPIDVQNLNKRFPVAAGRNWADTSMPNRIKILLDDTGLLTTIPGGDTYRFQFPVLMPPNVPRSNIWFASLCSDRACNQPTDAYVLVSFPMAGFTMGELAPVGLRAATSPAKRRTSLDLGACILLPLFALFLLAV